MRRVLVPLDGSSLSESILPDAQELAGEGGELILIRDPMGSVSDRTPYRGTEAEAVRAALADLEARAALLRDQGVQVETHALVMIDPAYSIGAAARIYHVDMMACATHGRGPLGRVVRGSVAWRALADSPVPVLVRHADAPSAHRSIFAPERRILVPLDGSLDAEKALPLSQDLAREWHAAIWLVHVISHYPITGLPKTELAPEAATDEEARQAALQYLDRIAAPLTVEVRKHVLFGAVAEEITAAVRAWDIGHVVMTSHGRTGLPRILLGSVADELIQRLSCPIIVIPSHAGDRRQDRQQEVSAAAEHPVPTT